MMHRFIVELVAAENAPWPVSAEPADLQEALFGSQPVADAIVAVIDEIVIGFALYFWTYSTVAGRPGLHLEDLYIEEASRGSGVGVVLLRHLARLAVDRSCARFEWPVLRSNEAAIRFYHRLQARELTEVQMMRLEGDALLDLAAR